jgi:hypothetical protein
MNNNNLSLTAIENEQVTQVTQVTMNPNAIQLLENNIDKIHWVDILSTKEEKGEEMKAIISLMDELLKMVHNEQARMTAIRQENRSAADEDFLNYSYEEYLCEDHNDESLREDREQSRSRHLGRGGR